MRRWLITILIFLLAGALVNIAVAWGSAAVTPDPMKGLSGTIRFGSGKLDSGHQWVLTRYEGMAATRILSRCYVGFFHHDGDTHEPQTLLAAWGSIDTPKPPGPASDAGGRNCQELIDDARGWPVRSMCCSWGTSDFALCPRGRAPLPLVSGIRLPGPAAGSIYTLRALPLRIWVPGFTVNTIFHAAVLWLLRLGLLVLRRLNRLRRGLCPACAYPMGDAPVCTECGRELPNRARSAT
jgi:hypothetical protein